MCVWAVSHDCVCVCLACLSAPILYCGVAGTGSGPGSVTFHQKMQIMKGTVGCVLRRHSQTEVPLDSGSRDVCVDPVSVGKQFPQVVVAERAPSVRLFRSVFSQVLESQQRRRLRLFTVARVSGRGWFQSWLMEGEDLRRISWSID